MKITHMEYRTVSVPFVPAIQEHWGMEYPTTPIWVYTDAGLVGLGESNSLPLDELPHIRVNDLSGGGLALSEGAVTVPEGPGLGVSLDLNAVEKYRIR